MPPNAATGIGLERPAVGLDELVVRGEPDRVGVLDDRDGRRGVVARDPVGGVEVEQVVERGPVALELGRVGKRARAVGRLAVERRALVRVLAVAQVVDLLQHEREPGREGVARDLVEVRGDLRVVGGDGAERLGRELRAQLRRDACRAPSARRRAAGSGSGSATAATPAALRAAAAQQRRAADVDHLDRLVDAAMLRRRPRGANGLTLTTTRSIRPMPVLGELLELLGTSRRARMPA